MLPGGLRTHIPGYQERQQKYQDHEAGLPNRAQAMRRSSQEGILNHNQIWKLPQPKAFAPHSTRTSSHQDAVAPAGAKAGFILFRVQGKRGS